ncbi:MAG: hypothetical protein AAGG02_10600 [Cyanobacteria bacterium P01_H01_bin.15]
MNGKIRLVAFSTWKYLNQPLTGRNAIYARWNLRQFWYRYRVEMLESCWRKAIPSETVTAEED